MPRPGPLQDLPLESFLPPNPNLSDSPRSSKRPLDSPGGPILYSPAKRRILTDEGIFSPEKTMKSPLSYSNQAAFAKFSQVLHSPESPAKKLDFGSSSQSQPSSSQSNVEQFTPRRSARLSNKSSPSPPSKSARKASSKSKMPRSGSSRSSAGSAIQQLDIDPQSIHYPGFIVYVDRRSDDEVSDYDMDVDVLEDLDEMELTKENIAPRRKLKKLVNSTESTPSKPEFSSSDSKKGDIDKSTKPRNSPSTPKSIFSVERLGGTTPRRSILRDSIMYTPPRTRADTRRQLALQADAIAVHA